MSKGTEEATNSVGQTVCGTGVVAQVTVRNSNASLNFGAKYPLNSSTAFIPGSVVRKLPSNFRAWENQPMKITGPVSLYKGKTQIIVTNTTMVLGKDPK